MARPTAYRDEYSEQVQKLARLGATDKDLADFFDVSEQTINTWKDKHPEFLESLKAGKAGSDMGVADRLHQRAMGYEWDEPQAIKVKEVIYQDGKRLKETERVEVVTVHRVVPPDTAACIFWLKNRRPDRWRDKQDHEHGVSDPLAALLKEIDGRTRGLPAGQ